MADGYMARVAGMGREFVSVGRRTPFASLYTNAFFLMANGVVTGLLGFLFWNVLTHDFSAGQVGIGSALISVCGLIASLANLGLGSGLIRFVPEAKSDVFRLINGSMYLVSLASIVGAAIYLAGLGLGYWTTQLAFLEHNVWLEIGFVVFSAATAVYTLLDHAFIAGRATRYSFYKNSLTGTLKIPIAVWPLAYLGGVGIFAATGAATVAGVLLALFFFLGKVFKGYRLRPARNFAILRPLFLFSSGNYLAGFFSNGIGYILPLMVLHYLGAGAAAYFYMPWMLNNIIGIPAGAVTSSLFAEGSHDPGSFSGHFYRSLGLSFLILIISVGSVELLAPWLLGLFGHEYSVQGIGLLRILALANFPATVNLLFVTLNRVMERVHLIVMQVAATSIMTLGASAWLIPRFGLVGTGIGYTAAAFVTALMVLFPLLRFLASGGERRGNPAGS